MDLLIKTLFVICLMHEGHAVPLRKSGNKGYSLWEGDIFRRRNFSPAFFMAPMDKYRQWLKRKVFYVVDPSYNDFERSVIHEAMNMIEVKSCIQFQQRKQEPDYVLIQPGPNTYCNSAVGKNGGEQPLSLAQTCFNDGPGLIVHELLHTLGFWHEHNRPDRDNYVRVMKDNIISDFLKNFQKRSANVVDLLGIDYDYGSIMHYGMYDFSEQPGVKPTIIPADMGVVIGQRKKLSEKDVQRINKLYKCDISECPEPVKGESVVMVGKAPWAIGDLVQYACAAEETLIGSPRRFCRFDGKWSGSQPECIDSKTSLSCNFEEGLCGWEQDSNDNFDWMRWNGATQTEHTGPMVDHTTEESTGYYVYAEASSPQKPGDKARIASPLYTPSSAKTCLTFSYYMWGQTVGMLSVLLRIDGKEDTRIWAENGNLGPTWHSIKLAFDEQQNFKVVFECEIGKKFLSDVAIDDFVLRPCQTDEDHALKQVSFVGYL